MVIQVDKISPAVKGANPAKDMGVPVQIARDGRFSKDILDITMDCAVPGQTGNSTVYTEAQAKQQIYDNMAELVEDSDISPADFISRCMTGEDAQALSDEGTPLEEYTSSQLERALSRVKEQRNERRLSVSGQVDREREEEQARQDAIAQGMADAGISDPILRQLKESGLPMSSDHVARLTQSVGLAAQVSGFSSAAMEFFIRGQFDVTPENISGSVYGAGAGYGESRMGNAMTGGSEFEQVREQAGDILKEAGMEPSGHPMEVAEWLYKNELPVTAENVRTCQQLEQLGELDRDTLAARIVDNLVDGVSAEKADLTKLSRKEAADAIREFVGTDDAVLRREYTAEVDFIRARRQMEEIRLLMTVEAMRSMSARGIRLDISNLEKIVEDLRQQERQAQDSLLLEVGLPVTETNASRMADTLQAARNVLAAPAGLLGTALMAGDDLTLTGLSETAVKQRETFDKMARTYETVGTEVRRDLGDSIRKAFASIGGVLEDLGMEPTAMNQRAARILGYNQMPLTKENIEKMKAYDDKVTTLMNNLKPPVVAELIRRQVNPLDIPLDELDAAVREVRETVVGEDISFRRFLWKMDHQGTLTTEERQSMIGVYRLLDKIEKSDGALIGQVVKEGRELSLSSLLSALRTRRAEGMDVAVSEEFGGLEDTARQGQRMDEQIRAAYGGSVARKVRQSLSPRVLREGDGEGIMELSLEELLEKCLAEGETEEEMKPYYQEMADDMAASMEDPGNRVQRFLEALSLPDSVANRMLAAEYLGGGIRQYMKMWKKSESDALREAFDDPEELDALYGKLDDAHRGALEQQKGQDDVTYGDAVSMAKMARSISFYQNLRGRQTYEVPIVTEQGITACHVTIVRGNGKKGMVEIAMESDELGRIQATFHVGGRSVRGFVTTEKPDGMDACRRILSGFKKDLEEQGFSVEDNSLVQGNRQSLHKVQDVRAGSVENRDLYQVAKCFLVNVETKSSKEPQVPKN